MRPTGERTSRDVASHREREKEQRQIRARDGRIETDRADRPGTGNADHADVAVRQRFPFLDDEVNDHPDRHREDREVVALAAQADRSDGVARSPRTARCPPAGRARTTRRLWSPATRPRTRQCRRSPACASDNCPARPRITLRPQAEIAQHVALREDLQVVLVAATTSGSSTAIDQSGDRRDAHDDRSHHTASLKQAGRLEREDQRQHDERDEVLVGRRHVGAAEALGEREQVAADQRARDAAHPAEHDDRRRPSG